MAAMDTGHMPPVRQASLQRMLDLEKKYKVSLPRWYFCRSPAV